VFRPPNDPAHLRRRAPAQASNRAATGPTRVTRLFADSPANEPDPSVAQYATAGDSARPESERCPRGAVRCSRRLDGHGRPDAGSDTPPAHRSRDAIAQGADSYWSACASPAVASSGGARVGRATGRSVGRSRCRRIRPMTATSSMSATRRRRPPQRGHASTSKPNVRLRRAVRRGGAGAHPVAWKRNGYDDRNGFSEVEQPARVDGEVG
jgi:hypothetical protein